MNASQGRRSSPSAADGRRKVPVPGPWQAAAVAAMSALAQERGLALEDIALTRAQPDPTAEEALELWLIAQGRGYRYRAGLDGGGVEQLAR